MRAKTLFAAVLFVLGGTGLAGVAGAQSGEDVIEQCRAMGRSHQECQGTYQFLRIWGGICRDATSDDPNCAAIDGIELNEELVLTHQESWMARALELQETLDDRYPIEEGLWPHTHNSFNADAYDFQGAGGTDRNQIYSIRDQLRMGIRAVELDIHWETHATSGGAKAVQVCHGNEGIIPFEVPEQGPDDVDGAHHAGCEANSPLLPEHLSEIRAWMDANPNDVIMLYLENALDGVPAAHDQATAAIASAFGNLVYKPVSGGGCQNLPIERSRKEIRDSGARIILTGNCGPGAWTNWVFDRGNGGRWREGGLDAGDDYPAKAQCEARRASQGYATNWIRHYADETGLSAGTGGGGDVTLNDARNMTNCGVNMIGFDNFVPLDERMKQLVWSWAENEPSVTAAGYCAVHNGDGRFNAESCKVTKKTVKDKRGRKRVVETFTAKPFACFDGTKWSVTSYVDKFSRGEAICQFEGRGHFTVPWNGYENQRLLDAKPAGSSVWLNHAVVGTAWL